MTEPSPDCASPPPKSRAHLIELLRRASEAEHSLCCQYLFAAFSLRRLASDFPDDLRARAGAEVELTMAATQRWAADIYWVARQEMAHLAMATNMRTALDERPYLEHGDFPDASLGRFLGSDMVLERCSYATLRRFQYIERPKSACLGPPPPIEGLYLDIRDLFTTLPAAELFTGDGLRQIDPQDVELGVSMTIVPVTGRASAVKAVNTILEQGEGLGAEPTDANTHFARFTAVVQDFLSLSRPGGLEPSLPVVPNPVSGSGPVPDGATRVTHAFSAALMDYFNAGYRLMLTMLNGFLWGFRGYAGPFEAVEALKTPAEMAAQRLVTILAENAYFPFMTMFIRPVGELLARQPAFADIADPARAGASFQTGRDIPMWFAVDPYLEALGALSDRAAALARGAPDAPTRDALVYLHQNLSRMRLNVANVAARGD